MSSNAIISCILVAKKGEGASFMKPRRLLALMGSTALAASFVAAAAGGATASVKSTPSRVILRGTLSPAVARSRAAGGVPAKSSVSFDLSLKLRNAAGARNFAMAVSTPHSKLFHHYLTDARWEARYGPTRTEVAIATAWLRREGFKVGRVANDRLFLPATGTAAQVERAFDVSLGYYNVTGHKLRLAKGNLSLPASLGGTVAGVVGVSQALESAGLSTSAAASASKPRDAEPAPPAGFRNPTPCSAYWGQKTDTADSPSLYAPYTSPLPYDICGYRPAQMRSAYGISGWHHNGRGVTVAIVDAYDSPTLLSDVQRYFRINDPSHPLRSSQFTNVEPATVDDATVCGGSGWYPEQALDVESVHTMATGAHIEFVGAQDCFDNNLLAAVNTAVTSGASVVTDSWGDTLGDLFDGTAVEQTFDTVFELADSTGVSVLFSSGDSGDNFADYGLDAPDYPATSPYITAVGGTTLEINRHGRDVGQYGWSTAKQVLCAPASTKTCGSATTPTGSLAWQAGGGGGTSYSYAEPSYQTSVVPSDLANRNDTVEGAARVEPDISMDADAQSGLLIGLTQTFPNGTYYAQFKEGGTSLASPLLAGVIADTDQAAGKPLGFLNPILYTAYTATPAAFDDIVPPADPDSAAVIRVDYQNEVDSSAGYFVSLRAINYAGPETYCDGTGNCATRPVTLTTAPGFDSLTGLGSIGFHFIADLSKY
jgi:subtilase family serine protease